MHSYDFNIDQTILIYAPKGEWLRMLGRSIRNEDNRTPLEIAVWEAADARKDWHNSIIRYNKAKLIGDKKRMDMLTGRIERMGKRAERYAKAALWLSRISITPPQNKITCLTQINIV